MQTELRSHGVQCYRTSIFQGEENGIYTKFRIRGLKIKGTKFIVGTCVLVTFSIADFRHKDLNKNY